ncbi:MATE family efflux transporter [Candidatus Woesearchaeota archaeon]|jgi:putative MATE family efflux protein|nr:MATE family efflux transporter [Candidatus Woesearchaeota archaeon]MBT6518402.1 MATE family efflux transporter [Candidatus Woesearchaeota archaeon]
MHKNSFLLGKEKISKALWTLSAPAMIGMLAISLYNLTDTIFIGRGVGTLGIAGVTIAFPIQMIIMAMAFLVGIGSASIISRGLGAKNKKLVSSCLGNFFILTILISILMTSLGIIFLVPLLKLFGASQSVLPYSVDYMRIVFFGSIFLAFSAASNNIIRAEGNAKFAMVVMLVGVGLNIILDPIFIFVFNMGIQGAALATVIGNFVGAIVSVYYFFSKKSGIKLKLSDFKPNFKIIKELFAVGSSSFARQVSMIFISVIINHSLGFYGGDISIAAFGIVHRALMFSMLPMMGIVQGLQPLVGFNYGAKNFKRTKEAIILAIKATSVMGFVSFLIIMLFANPIVNLFSTDLNLIALGSHAARIVILLFPLVGFQIIASGAYQAMGKSKPALLLSLLRQTLIFIPIVLVLPYFFGLFGVFAAFPISDFISAIITYFIFSRDLKKIGTKNNS